ncbi:hypothetical protein [Deinococcus humi]|uniref:Uncharacterized protein n=1 Tax=Deinococcus humi TaxID=662880 RepID=A0A7W8JYG8_9DEIO|nr:hypothetical protein [Deinococcus humi]MBB5364029.1 hypothetical protein [Deinococcus humi]
MDGRVRVGLPVRTGTLARELWAEGRCSLVVYRAGRVDYAADWAETPGASRLCDCTDGGRNQPLINCPHCRGEGTVTE